MGEHSAWGRIEYYRVVARWRVLAFKAKNVHRPVIILSLVCHQHFPNHPQEQGVGPVDLLCSDIAELCARPRHVWASHGICCGGAIHLGSKT